MTIDKYADENLINLSAEIDKKNQQLAAVCLTVTRLVRTLDTYMTLKPMPELQKLDSFYKKDCKSYKDFLKLVEKIKQDENKLAMEIYSNLPGEYQATMGG